MITNSFFLARSPTGLARWRDPRTDQFYNGVNSLSIGIEIANTGMQSDCHKKLGTGKPYPDGTTIQANHRNGSKGSSEARDGKVWEVDPEAQLKAVFDLVSLLLPATIAFLPNEKPTPALLFPCWTCGRPTALADCPKYGIAVARRYPFSSLWKNLQIPAALPQRRRRDMLIESTNQTPSAP